MDTKLKEGEEIGQVERNSTQDLMTNGSNEEEHRSQDERHRDQIQSMKAISPLDE